MRSHMPQAAASLSMLTHNKCAGPEVPNFPGKIQAKTRAILIAVHEYGLWGWLTGTSRACTLMEPIVP